MLLNLNTSKEDESLLARQLRELNDLEDLQKYVLPLSDCVVPTTASKFNQAVELRQQVEQVLSTAYDELRQGRQLDLAAVDGVIAATVAFMEHQKEIMLALVLLGQYHETTYRHASHVAILLMAFGFSVGAPIDQVRTLGLGGLLHDVGITRITVNVLQKIGRLTARERSLMELHCKLGFELLDQLSGLPKEVPLMALQHHERYNGSGYPKKLFRDHIHDFAMMTSIVDTFSAMTNERSWRGGVTPSLALSKMLAWSQSRFHPELLQKFIRCVGIYPVGTLLRFRNNLLGLVVQQNAGRLLYPVVKIFFDAVNRVPVPQIVINLADPRHRGDIQWSVLRSQKNGV
ncbi:MAG: HD domain-containing protein [Magnetococcales bacterium]|nr:HD domain-containing protein [Magnetococcales bacterium]